MPGSDRIPHATTIGKFLWRFGDDQHDKQRQGLAELRDTTEAVQQEAFGMLPRERRKVATLDWDSSIHEVYGQKKEGADFAYDNTWSYSALYGTLAETGDVLYLGLREGYRHTSYGTKEVLPGTIERVSKHFRQVRMRADSGYYSQALVKICEQRGVEFFIVAKRHRNLMNAVREIPESQWKSFSGSDLQTPDQGRRRRRRRANLKRKIAIRRKPNGSWSCYGHPGQVEQLPLLNHVQSPGGQRRGHASRSASPSSSSRSAATASSSARCQSRAWVAAWKSCSRRQRST